MILLYYDFLTMLDIYAFGGLAAELTALQVIVR